MDPWTRIRNPASSTGNMLKVTIDNVSIEVDEGTTILQAARMIGGKIVPPAMCYYSKLRGSGGKCRTCLVKVAPRLDQRGI